jgi:hypothetical protein
VQRGARVARRRSLVRHLRGRTARRGGGGELFRHACVLVGREGGGHEGGRQRRWAGWPAHGGGREAASWEAPRPGVLSSSACRALTPRQRFTAAGRRCRRLHAAPPRAALRPSCRARCVRPSPSQSRRPHQPRLPA